MERLEGDWPRVLADLLHHAGSPAHAHLPWRCGHVVPLEQSEWFRDRAVKLDRNVDMVVHPGRPTRVANDDSGSGKFADWFDMHLRADIHFNPIAPGKTE